MIFFREKLYYNATRVMPVALQQGLKFIMRKKNVYLKQKADKKLLLRNYIFRALVALMVIIVLYDSFIHNTPLYYVCYYFFGLLVGKIVSIADRVKHRGEDQTFTIALKPV